MNDVHYRYELKYVCSHLQMAELEQRIESVLYKDPHVGENGFYTIRSLYFDDYYNSAYWDKENGTDNRKKYRIRVYDGDMDTMSLEIKGKLKDKTSKEKARITYEQYRSLVCPNLVGDAMLLRNRENEVLNQLLLQKAVTLMRPVIIVEYDRMPFVAAEGNVRITLDRNIRSSARTEAFADPNPPMRGIMPDGEHLMEIKFDEFLPDVIYRTLNLENLNRTSFSKYYLCRKYY